VLLQLSSILHAYIYNMHYVICFGVILLSGNPGQLLLCCVNSHRPQQYTELLLFKNISELMRKLCKLYLKLWLTCHLIMISKGWLKVYLFWISYKHAFSAYTCNFILWSERHDIPALWLCTFPTHTFLLCFACRLSHFPGSDLKAHLRTSKPINFTEKVRLS
jgi:hypothetical protein